MNRKAYVYVSEGIVLAVYTELKMLYDLILVMEKSAERNDVENEDVIYILDIDVPFYKALDSLEKTITKEEIEKKLNIS